MKKKLANKEEHFAAMELATGRDRCNTRRYISRTQGWK